LLQREFAVILLDVNMPRMSGLETAALIRQRKKSRHTPIIFITAFADDAQTAEGYGLGAVDYILTPIVPEILRAKVRAFVELFQMRQELGRSHALLEQRVADRTVELEMVAADLRREVHERKLAEERLTILVQELAHRVKNLLSVFQSIAARTLVAPRSISEAREVLLGRLQSLGHAHELLTETNWRGAELTDIVKAEVAGFSERVCCSGPTLTLSPTGVQTFALIVHELSTNAAKYGALSNETGEVLVKWALGGEADEDYMEFSWKEHGGPPVKPASHEGFGLSLIAAMGNNLAAPPDIVFARDGFACAIRVPLDTITPSRHDKAWPVIAQHTQAAPSSPSAA
ncbi:MAG TPA: HWE histidine kinase domain-containing protein, partial [Hyphomicrobiaceae bacterium]|nr:HWE histidine kinase domain-containing protein [Hyphomicrobiaceae bacterium]